MNIPILKLRHKEELMRDDPIGGTKRDVLKQAKDSECSHLKNLTRICKMSNHYKKDSIGGTKYHDVSVDSTEEVVFAGEVSGNIQVIFAGKNENLV